MVTLNSQVRHIQHIKHVIIFLMFLTIFCGYHKLPMEHFSSLFRKRSILMDRDGNHNQIHDVLTVHVARWVDQVR